MKPTELMIRDWVQDNLSHVIQIESITDSEINLLWDGCESYGGTNIKEIEPIPLTLEILERNGFELRDGFFYHRIDDKPHHYDFKLKNGGVFTSEGYTLVCGIYHLTIRYVHELQHALRLCGLNDLADNFKMEE